jgi:hypothetical protein
LDTRNGLSARTRADARAFAEAFFARSDEPLPSDRLDHFERELSDFFGHVRGRARLLFLACLFTATWGAPLLGGRAFARLSSLSIAERLEVLERLEHFPIAQLALYALKAITSLVYYEHPDARAELGWDQRCFGNKALPVLTRSSEDEE